MSHSTSSHFEELRQPHAFAPARARRLTISPANYVDDDVAMTMCIDASDVSLQSVDRASVLKRLMMMRRHCTELIEPL